MLFRRSKGIRHPLFPGLRAAPAAESRPRRYDALAGSFGELANAAMRGATATRGVLVVQREGEHLPGEEQRAALWDWFRVPSYVVQVDGDGKVRAYECEARIGLHQAQAVDGRVECDCGRPGFLPVTSSGASRSEELTAA